MGTYLAWLGIVLLTTVAVAFVALIVFGIIKMIKDNNA